MFNFGKAMGSGDRKGLEEYGEHLHIDSPIDAYPEAMEELADAVKYVTLLNMRYRLALIYIAQLEDTLDEWNIPYDPSGHPLDSTHPRENRQTRTEEGSESKHVQGSTGGAPGLDA